MQALYSVIAAVLGYFIGSLNASLVIGRLKGVDIRKQGSGNAGATNAVRILGKKTGYAVFLLDFVKGILACLIGWALCKNQMWAGLFAVIGHVFPAYFGLRGGKGISTTLGVILFWDWRIFLITAAWMLLFIGITKIVSVSTLSGILLTVVCFGVLHMGDWYLLGGAVVLAFLTFIKHRENIKRLMNGTENKFGKK